MTEKDEKQRLIEQMRSRDNAEALAAVAAMQLHGWLYDGTLHEADLTGAHLAGADLERADLRNVVLREAVLSKAILSKADLIGADLIRADLPQANLTGANLRFAHLLGADLFNADLSNADLFRARLSEANLLRTRLMEASLSEADFFLADLSGANLSGAMLTETSLIEANLSGANLAEADLSGANLFRATLTEAVFRQALCGSTFFLDLDLSDVVALETIQHYGPSSLDTRTLFRSKNLPEAFLRGCGLPDNLINYLPSFTTQAIQFYSGFISYSHADAAFARQLHDRLQGQGIRCWLDEHQMNPGDKIVREVSQAIRVWDKVLLCCSETALQSWWVDKEITMVLGKEEELSKQRGEEVLALIPLDLDGYLFGGYRGEYEKLIKGRNVAGFQGWKSDHDLFEAQLQRVVRALTVGGGKLPPPQPKL